MNIKVKVFINLGSFKKAEPFRDLSIYPSLYLSMDLLFVRRMRDLTSWLGDSGEVVFTKLLPLYLKMNLDIPMQVVELGRKMWIGGKQEKAGAYMNALRPIRTDWHHFNICCLWLWWYRFPAEAEALCLWAMQYTTGPGTKATGGKIECLQAWL